MSLFWASIALLISVNANAAAPIVWKGSRAAWLATGLKIPGVVSTDSTGEIFVTNGTVGQVYTANGAGTVPSWQSASGGLYSVRFGGASDPSDCTASPCTIYQQRGALCSVVNKNGTGDYTCTFTSAFSQKPNCVVSGAQNSVDITDVHTTSTTSVRVVMFSNSGTNRDGSMTILCSQTN